MNDSYESGTVSNTNHSLPAYPFLSDQHGSSLPALRAPITHFDYLTPMDNYVLNDGSFFPTVEFRVPLLPQALCPQTLGLASDLQISVPALRPWCHKLSEELALDVNGVGAHARTAPAVSATISVSVPPCAQQASASATDATVGTLPLTVCSENPGLFKEETNLLPLRDMYHFDSTTSFDHLGYPSFTRNLDSLAQDPSCKLSDNNAYSECPSADFLALPQTPSSSVPSLSYGSFSGSENDILSPPRVPLDDLLRVSLTPPLRCKAEEDDSGLLPTLGIYADVNMRERAWQDRSPTFCVNPADVMTDSLEGFGPRIEHSDSPSPGPDAALRGSTPTPALCSSPDVALSDTLPRPGVLSPKPDYSIDFPDDALIDNVFPQEAISAIVAVLKSSSMQEANQSCSSSDPSDNDKTSLLHPVSERSCELAAPRPVYPSHGHNYPGSDFGMLQDTSGRASQFDPLSRPGRRPLAELRLPQFQYSVPSYPPYPPVTEVSHAAYTPAKPRATASPVLNAHAGVSLEELRRRAAKYRERNAGADLDKNFLQCFAGRLSAHGELIEEYRCYVGGCEQRNKRRDHILVHVGSHVEHRPWSCRHCGMRFLRKNECKRHESSHEGLKPYSCQICAPFQNKSFVRQDLLKRHLRVTHGVQDTGGRRRGPVKKDNDEYWP